MARTTLDIDDPILRELKRLQQREHKSIGRIVSDLLAQVLGQRESSVAKKSFRWSPRDMGVPRVPLTDKEALHALLDVEHSRAKPR